MEVDMSTYSIPTHRNGFFPVSLYWYLYWHNIFSQEDSYVIIDGKKIPATYKICVPSPPLFVFSAPVLCWWEVVEVKE